MLTFTDNVSTYIIDLCNSLEHLRSGEGERERERGRERESHTRGISEAKSGSQ